LLTDANSMHLNIRHEFLKGWGGFRINVIESWSRGELRGEKERERERMY
jgi:hypothetical protein